MENKLLLLLLLYKNIK